MTQEVLKLALEALENSQNFVDASANAKLKTGWGEQLDKADKAITAIKEALAQPEQEPDKYMMDIECTKCGAKQSGILTVNTTPPHRKPLTVDEVWQNDELMALNAELGCGLDLLMEVVEAIEAAHGIKEDT